MMRSSLSPASASFTMESLLRVCCALPGIAENKAVEKNTAAKANLRRPDIRGRPPKRLLFVGRGKDYHASSRAPRRRGDPGHCDRVFAMLTLILRRTLRGHRCAVYAAGPTGGKTKGCLGWRSSAGRASD